MARDLADNVQTATAACVAPHNNRAPPRRRGNPCEHHPIVQRSLTPRQASDA
jgi:hypothetical protein